MGRLYRKTDWPFENQINLVLVDSALGISSHYALLLNTLFLLHKHRNMLGARPPSVTVRRTADRPRMIAFSTFTLTQPSQVS